MVGGTDSTSLHRTRWPSLTEVDELRSLASEVGAVNTIGSAQGRLWGANTDGFGVEELLSGLSPKRVLVLGAGGAARVVLRVLGRDPNLSITLVNRTWEHAVALAAHTPSVEVDTLGRVADKMSHFDLVMNCLPEEWSSGPPRSKTGSLYE